MKYKVGDKVRYKYQKPNYNVEVGEVGTICGFSEATKRYGVAFETKDIGKHSCDGLCLNNYGWWCDEDTLEPVVSTLAEIKEKKLTCCINVKNIAEAQFLDIFFECESYLKGYCIKNYTDRVGSKLFDGTLAFQLTDGIIDDCCSANFYRSCGGRYGEVYEFSDLFPVGSTIVCGDRMYQRTESGITNYKLVPKYKESDVVSIHDLPISEWYNPMRLTFKNGSSIEALPNTSDVIRSTSDFCTGFKGGNTPTSLKMEVVKDRTKTMKDWVDNLADAWAKLGCTTFRMSPSEVDKLIKKTEDKKLKFTFYVKEGTRIDKSCNKTVPTMTTFVSIGRYHSGKATCDKVDYDERQGCLEAIANAFLDGNFDREFNKAVKKNERTELHNRTCTYCGKVFDTVEELKAHEAWHVERKKARRERYLLRKRAKEIAFEEQAQKMAKEMIEK